MACERFEERIVEYVDGAPDHVLEEHLRSCAACRDTMEVLTALDRSLAACLTPPAVPAQVSRRVLGRVTRLERAGRANRFPPLLDFIGIAGVAVGAVWFLTRAPQLTLLGLVPSSAATVLPWAIAGACLSAGFLFALTCLTQPVQPVK
jgi:predicted anti-sigma-YlaC factor YlaD